MSESGASARSPIPIGEAANPPFVRLPDPPTQFRVRAQRFAVLSQGHALEPYLRFLAGLAEAQHRVQDGLPEPKLPDADAQARAREFGMPPLDRGHFTPDVACEATLDRLFDLATQIEMPEAARSALGRVTAMAASERGAMIRNVLDDAAEAATIAEHVFAAAALQVHFARMAARLDGPRLVPVGDGACPACGGPPVASMVVGWTGAHGTRKARNCSASCSFGKRDVHSATTSSTASMLAMRDFRLSKRGSLARSSRPIACSSAAKCRSWLPIIAICPSLVG